MTSLVRMVAVLSLVTVAWAQKTCKDLPTDIVHDGAKLLAPYGSKWQLYQTIDNIEGERKVADSRNCLNFQYLPNRNGDENNVTILLINRGKNFHVAAKQIVSDGMTTWTYIEDSGKETVYHKLLFKDDEEDSYNVLYSCDSDFRYIDDLVTFAMTKKGKNALRRDLDKLLPDLPLRPTQQIVEVYVNCPHKKPIC